MNVVAGVTIWLTSDEVDLLKVALDNECCRFNSKLELGRVLPKDRVLYEFCDKLGDAL